MFENLAGAIAGWATGALGRNLSGSANGKSPEFILDETIGKYESVEFLSKKKARDALRILEEVKNNKKLTRAIDGFVNGYSMYVSSSLKNVIPWLKNYIKFWDGLKKSGSILQLQKFKGDLINNLKSIEHILKLDEQKHNKYSMNKVMEAAGAAGKNKNNITLADYLKSVLLPTVTSSIENLERNDIEKCAIYIGEKDTELGDSKSGVINTGGAKLNYDLLEMKEEKQVFEKGVSKTINKKMKLFGKISEGNKKNLEELRKSCNKYLKKSEGILQKIEGRLEELNSHGEAKSRNSSIDQKIKDYEETKNKINACVNGSESDHNDNNLKKLYGKLMEEKNMAKAEEICKKFSECFKEVGKCDKQASTQYKAVLNEIKIFEGFMSDTAKLKKECKKYTDVIDDTFNILKASSTNKDMDIMGMENHVIRNKYPYCCNILKFFGESNLDGFDGDMFKKLKGYDIENAKIEVQEAYDFIKEFYRVSVKLGKLSEVYNKVLNGGEYVDKNPDNSIDGTVMNSYKIAVKIPFVIRIKEAKCNNLNDFEKELDAELKEAKKDLVYANKFREVVQSAIKFEDKYKEKEGIITNDMSSSVSGGVGDREEFRKGTKGFSDKYEKILKGEKTDSLKKSTKRIDRLKGKVRSAFSRSSRKEI